MCCRRLGSTLLVAGVLGAVMAPGALASRLVIPGLGSFQTQASLNAGPWQYWHDEDTIAIAGHRTTHSHPFLRLNEVRRGDEIALGKKTFVVRHVRVVRATETWILNWKGLLLSACARSDGSPTSLSYRIVVMAKEM